MHKRIKSFLTILITSSILISSNAGTVFASTPAASSSSGSSTSTSTCTSGANGYLLSTLRTDITVARGSTGAVTLIVQNISKCTENLKIVVNDFEAPNNESGFPALLLNGATAPSHSLKQFVVIPNPFITIQPKQQVSISVNVVVPTSAESGGYYGAVRLAPVTIAANGAKNVNLGASVASLVLLTIPGNLKENLSIVDFGVTQGTNGTQTHKFLFNNKNLQGLVSFQNNGNVQVQPIGSFSIYKGSKRVSTAAVNSTSSPGNVLPSSIRRFTVPISNIGSLGVYKITGKFNYGSNGQVLTKSDTFYVIPVIAIIIFVVLIILIILLILAIPRMLRRYNRRVIERSNKHRH